MYLVCKDVLDTYHCRLCMYHLFFAAVAVAPINIVCCMYVCTVALLQYCNQLLNTT